MMPLVHHHVCRFDVPGEEGGVEQGRREAIAFQFVLNCASRPGLVASAMASLSYSSWVEVMSSGKPIALSRLAATRPAKVSPSGQHRQPGPQGIACRVWAL